MVTLLGFIEQAQALGFTLREVAGVKVNKDAENPISCSVALPMLEQKLATVEALIVEAQGRKARIEALIAQLRENRESEEALAVALAA